MKVIKYGYKSANSLILLARLGGFEPPISPTRLLPDDLHQHPLLAATIKLTIKNLFPGAEV